MPTEWTIILGGIFIIMLVWLWPERVNPKPILCSGVYEHEQTKMRFPQKVLGFDRVAITAFDPTTGNVGVGYNSEGEPRPAIAMTVYVYPTKQGSSSLENEFRGCLEEISKLWKVPQAASREFSMNIGTRSVSGWDGFIVDAQNTGNFCGLILFSLGDWYVKYRFTFSLIVPDALKDMSGMTSEASGEALAAHFRENMESGRKRSEHFMESLPWPSA